MKKILFLLVLSAIAFSSNSCSGDDNSPKKEGTISFKVNGVQQEYTTVYVTTTTSHTGDFVEVELDVYGYYIYDKLHLHMDRDTLEDTVSFIYEVEDIEYARDANFAVQLTANGSDKKLIGSFSGDLISPEGTILTITEGTFNIQY
jgi:hypothetical protein